MQHQQGIETRLLEQGELRELEPDLTANILAALYCPNDGTANHVAMTNAYAAAAQKNGPNC